MTKNMFKMEVELWQSKIQICNLIDNNSKQIASVGSTNESSDLSGKNNQNLSGAAETKKMMDENLRLKIQLE